MAERYQVIIAGGGPVGVAMAVDLGLRGIDCLVVGRHLEPQQLPKGQNLTQRTLEHFYLWGVVDELRRARIMPKGYLIGGVTAYGDLMSEYWYAPVRRGVVRSFYYEDSERLPQYLTPNPPKGYGGGVDTGDDGYGKANGPGPVPIDGVEGSGRWPRQWPGGGRQWRRPAKTARRHAGSGTGGLGWHEFAGQPQGLSSGRVGRRRRAVRLAGEWRAIGPGRN